MTGGRHRSPARTLGAVVLVAGLVLASCASPSTSRRASEADDPTSTSESTSTTVRPTGDGSTTSTSVADRPSTDGTTSTTATSTTSTTTASTTTTTTTTLPLVPTDVVHPCATRVAIGPLEMRAASPDTCLRRSGLEWTTNQRVTVGGIDFRPTSDTSVVRFDPFNAHVYATGYRAMGTVLGAPLVIAEGVIDWSFQYSAGQNGPVGAAMPVAADTVDLATVARLPGLSDVRTFPKQPVNGFADYTVVTDASVRQLVGRFPSLATPTVEFPLTAIGLREIPAYTVSIPSTLVQQIAGLDISGSVTMQPVARAGAIGIALSAQLDLPDWLAGFKGRFGAFFPTAGGVQIDALLIDIPEVDLGVVRFEGVYLNYKLAENKWEGRVAVLLGSGADAIGLQGTLSIVGGRLQSVGVAVTGLPIAIGANASINALGGVLSLSPLGVRATGQLGIGPFVSKVGNIAVVDGALVFDTTELSMRGILTIGKVKVGGLELKGLRVADARIAYYWAGQFNIDGNASF